MTDSDKDGMTQLLKDWRGGNPAAREKISPIVYDALKRIAIGQMRKEREGHTLQATVLVNDVYMELLNEDVDWVDSAHFRALSATIMRRTLIDHARGKGRVKRGGDQIAVTLLESRVIDDKDGIDVLTLDDLMNKLASFDERQAKVIELTFFGGLTYAEIAEVLGISKATVDRELRIGKAWLLKKLQEGG